MESGDDGPESLVNEDMGGDVMEVTEEGEQVSSIETAWQPDLSLVVGVQ